MNHLVSSFIELGMRLASYSYSSKWPEFLIRVSSTELNSLVCCMVKIDKQILCS